MVRRQHVGQRFALLRRWLPTFPHWAHSQSPPLRRQFPGQGSRNFFIRPRGTFGARLPPKLRVMWREDRTMDNPKQERRNEARRRRRALKKARITFKGRWATIDCTVLNLSDLGASLRVESPIGIPDTFGCCMGIRSERRLCEEVQPILQYPTVFPLTPTRSF